MIHKQNKERKTNNENNSDFSLMSDVAAEAGAATLSGVPGLCLHGLHSMWSPVSVSHPCWEPKQAPVSAPFWEPKQGYNKVAFLMAVLNSGAFSRVFL